MIIITN